MAPFFFSSTRTAAVLASLACTADALEQLRGAARLQQTPPVSLSSIRKQQEAALENVGPFAWDANTVGVRLPDNMASPAWGDDQIKASGSDGFMLKDFAAGRFFSGGTDGKTQAHALAGIGYAGFKDKLKKSDVRGVIAAGKADKEGLDIMAAVPRPDANGNIGMDYARTRAVMKSGHIPAAQLTKTLPGAAGALRTAAVKMSSDETAQPPKAAPATGEESYNKTESAILTSRFMKDFNDYQVKLMILDFPYQSALWFAAMRGWCINPEHGLAVAEEARKLKALEGRYKVIKDTEVPHNVDQFMTIQDGKLFLAGERVMDTTFKAYVDNKFASITPLLFPVDNSTVQLHKIFTVDGSRLHFEGGNVWERAKDSEPARPAGTEWLKKLLSMNRK